MTNKTKAIAIAVVALAVAIGAAVSMRGREAKLEAPTVAKTQFAPELAGKLESIDRIEIDTANDDINLERKNGKWTVEQYGGYWANDVTLKQLFAGLSDLEIVETKTNNPEWHERLGLDDPSKKDAKGIRVTLRDAGHKLSSFIVGESKTGAGSTRQRYMRRDGDNQAYLVRTPMEIANGKSEWANKQIADIQADRVKSVTIDRWDHENVEIARDKRGDANFELKSMPRGAELAPSVNLLGIARGFQGLTLQDVKPSTNDFDSLTSQTIVTAKTYDGLTLQLNVRGGKDNNWYAQVKASYDESLRPAEPKADETKTTETLELEKKLGPLASADDVKKEADRINELANGWTYQLPTWKVTQFAKSNSELFKFPEPKKEAVSLEPTEIRASHILIAWEGAQRSNVKDRTKEQARKLAEDVLKQAKEKPGDFSSLAGDYSNDAGSALKGGDLGKFTRETMTPPFSKAAFALPVGGMSEIVETEFGFHIIKRTE